jgi:hypothetical protein
MSPNTLATARSLSRDALRDASMRHFSASLLANDARRAEAPSRVGAHLTARQMALKPHNLSKDGMEAFAEDGGHWKWSNHFSAWACVSA